MERDKRLLLDLQKKLRGWFPVIKRSVHPETLQFRPGEDIDFFLEASGKNKDGSPWVYEMHFTRDLCLGDSLRLSPDGWRVIKRPCDFARLFIHEVLRARRVIQ